jgi:hypothetical protein
MIRNPDAEQGPETGRRLSLCRGRKGWMEEENGGAALGHDRVEAVAGSARVDDARLGPDPREEFALWATRTATRTARARMYFVRVVWC